jgi:transcription initiation factor TFIIB
MEFPILGAEWELSSSEPAHGKTWYAATIGSTNAPATLAFHDLGLSTEIAAGFRDGQGKPLEGKARYRAILLRKWHSRTRTKDGKDLSMAKALSSLNDLADRLDLPAYVREEASAIYRKIAAKRLTIGRSKESLVVVSVYAAIRRASLPIMLRDFLRILEMRPTEFNVYFNAVKRLAKIKVPPPDPVAWIPKIASECHFSQRCQLLAARYVQSMIRIGETFGFLPHVVAAIALYRMGTLNGERKSVYEVARVANCAVTSIMKGFVSDSEAQRNGKKHKGTENGPTAITERRLEDWKRQKGGEWIPSQISNGHLFVSDLRQPST